jgi:phospholipase/carboxylesterase
MGYLHSQVEVKDYPPPVLIIHGKQDMVVPLRVAQRAKDELTQLGVNIEYHELNMGHEIVPQVMGLVQNFIKQKS